MPFHRSLTVFLICCCGFTLASPSRGQEQTNAPPKTAKAANWHGYAQKLFKIEDRNCYVVAPKQTAAGSPWVWRARFPNYHPEADLLLLERGFHIAHIDTGGMLGSPTALEHWDAFYRHVTQEFQLAPQAALEAVSRGGLFAYRWASKNPSKVSCVYADTPVCDFKSWPLGQGTGIGSEPTWKNLLKQYQLSEEEALQYRENPIDVLQPLAAAKIPLLHIVSLNDRVVPPKENTFVLAKRYRQLGGEIEIIEVTEGERLNGHHFDHPDPKRVADFIEQHSLEHNGDQQGK